MEASSQNTSSDWAWLRSPAVREIIQTVALTIIIFLALRAAIQTFVVAGPSMQPGLYTGERLLIDRISWVLGSPQRGDVVVFHHHHIPTYDGEVTSSCTIDSGTNGLYQSCDYVKRIIGVPGDTVQVTQEHIIVNGVTLNEPYVDVVAGQATNEGVRLSTTQLGPNQYFVCGDNRLNSSDSRSWGVADRQDFVGRAVMVFYPFGDLKILPSYAHVFDGISTAPIADTTPSWAHALLTLLVALVVLGVVLAVALLLFTYWRAQVLLAPVRKEPGLRPADVGLEAEEVWITSPRGRLAAWYVPARNGCTLVCCHGINDTRSQWVAPVARLHHERGYGALLFDFAGHGESEGTQVTYGVREQEDIAAVLAYLRERGDVDMRCVGLMGYSLGAIAGVLAAAAEPDLRALVLESCLADLQRDVGVLFRRFTGLPAFPFANLVVFWGQLISKVRLSDIRPEGVIGGIAPRAVLIISDLKDSLVDEPHDGELLYAHAGEPKRLWQAPDVEHVQAFTVLPDEWITRVEAFLDEHLAKPISGDVARESAV